MDDIGNYLPLVRKVVNTIARRLPSHVDLEDLQSVGVTGLIAAFRKFDPTQGKTFEAYAVLRIRGAILDELRRVDCLPRTARAKARRMQAVVERLEQRFGRCPTDEEIRRELDLSPRSFERLQRQIRPVILISLDHTPENSENGQGDLHEAIADEDQCMGFEDVQNSEMAEILAKKIACLPIRQQKVLAMYFYEEMRLTEIAEVFGVTEARVCQIRAQGLNNLRRSLEPCLEMAV